MPLDASSATKPQYVIFDLTSAINTRNWDKAVTIVKSGEIDVTQKVGNNSDTLAHLAAKGGSVKLLKALHEQGAPIENVYNDDGYDVLHVAVLSKSMDVIRWLAKEGVDLDRLTKGVSRFHPFGGYGESPRPALHLCLRKDRYDVAECLLQSGASPDARNDEGETGLMLLAANVWDTNNALAMRFLLAHGADINALNGDHESALIYALQHAKSYRNFQLLLDAGAQTDNSNSPISVEDYISSNGLPAIAHETLWILENRPCIDGSRPFRKEDLFRPDEYGFAALDNPATWQHIGAIMERLDAQGERLTKRDLMQKNAFGQSWFERAIDCRAYNRLADALHKQCTPMKGSDFADPRGPNGLNELGAYAEKAFLGVSDFASLDYWKDKGAATFSQFCQGLPPCLRDQIPSRHQLGLDIAIYEQSRGIGR